MKLAKLLVCVCVSLLGFAVAGVGGASATELCANIACSEVYESGQALEAESGNSTFATSLGTVACTGSTLKGETTAESGAPLPGKVTTLSFSGCKLGEGSCTVSGVHLSYTAAIEETSTGDGTMIVTNSGSGKPGVEITCSTKISCTLSSAEPKFGISGGSPAHLSIETSSFETSGTTCPKETKWTAEYTQKKPDPMMAGKVATVLCRKAPDANGVCPKGEGYTGKVYGELAAGVGSFEDFTPTGKKISCEEVSLIAEYMNPDPIGELTVEYKNKGPAPCSSNFPKSAKTKANPPVTVTLETQPFMKSFFMYKPVGATQGTLSFGPGVKEFIMVVEATVTCKYGRTQFTNSTAAISNGAGTNPTLAVFNGSWTLSSENPAASVCPLRLVESYTLALTRQAFPEIVYLAKSVAP